MHLQLTQGIDVALIVLNAFFLFFLGLVVYLRREDRREGYPLEHEMTGRLEGEGGAILTAPTKYFKLPFGHGTVSAPTKGREPVNIAARRMEHFAGSPLVPTGNPLVDGIGPAAFAERAKRPDLDWEGHPRIVPIGASHGLTLSAKDPDPRGYAVFGFDNVRAGTVSEVWVDKADRLIRYLQVEVAGGRQVMLPLNMAVINRSRPVVTTDSVTAAQFADCPGLESPGIITLYEEERVQAYFGGGYLYATPERSEPIL